MDASAVNRGVTITDATAEIARSRGVRFAQHEYVNSATQKNWAIPQATACCNRSARFGGVEPERVRGRGARGEAKDMALVLYLAPGQAIRIKPGEKIRLAFNPKRAHFFDGQTEVAVRKPLKARA